MKTTLLTAVLAGVLMAAPVIHAAPDVAQQQMIQRIQDAKLKLKAAEDAKGAQRQKLMQEHMQMMEETLGKMQGMKPRAGMSPKEQQEWIDEHQKLMQQLMGQMMDEHHLLLQEAK